MGRVVVDLEADRTGRAGVSFVADAIAGREVGGKIQDVRAAHGVLEEAAAILLPFALQVAGGDGDLIGRSADDGVVGDPVGIGSEDIEARVHGFAAFRHLFEIGELLFAAAARVVELALRTVADRREIASVEECAVVGELGQFRCV